MPFRCYHRTRHELSINVQTLRDWPSVSLWTLSQAFSGANSGALSVVIGVLRLHLLHTTDKNHSHEIHECLQAQPRIPVRVGRHLL